MVREILTVSWCDLCMSADGTRAEVAESHRVVLDGKGYDVDLCAEHHGEYKAFADLVATASATHRATPEPVKGLKAPSREQHDRSCLLCSHVVRSSSGLSDHVRESHALRTTEMFGLTCPLCGSEHLKPQGLGVHARATHSAEHPQVTETSAAFLVAESLGDPLGIVARQRKAAQKLSDAAVAKREREAATSSA